jgi:large subunit ribosomal protein L25
MKKITLKAKLREKKDGKKIAEKKQIPAILYGRGLKNKMLWVDYLDFSRIYGEVGESTLVELSVDGDGQDHRVLIYDVQQDPVTDEFSHADFYQVKMDEEIETEVELEFVGEAPAVKELGGVLVKNMDTIEVKCLPGDLPGDIIVDISKLKTFDDHIYVKDLPISDKVKIDVDPETVVALVSEPRSDEELSQLDEKVEADIDQVEGIKEKEEAAESGEKKERKSVDEK